MSWQELEWFVSDRWCVQREALQEWSVQKGLVSVNLMEIEAVQVGGQCLGIRSYCAVIEI